MTESRWRHPRVPSAATVLLLPELPSTAQVWSGPSRWVATLERYGITTVAKTPARPPQSSRGRGRTRPTSGATAGLVIAPPWRAVRSGADVIVVEGRDRWRLLARAGFHTASYVARRSPSGAVQLQPPRRTTVGENLLQLGQRGGVRRLVISAIRGLRGSSYVTVGHRTNTTPAVVAAAYGQTSNVLLIAGEGVGGPRRRSTFLVAEDGGRATWTAVKVAVTGSRSRGRHEQQVLRQLQEARGLAGSVPRPKGEGQLGPVCWSAESAVQGRPLRHSLRAARPERMVATLGDLAAWFTALAVSTRRPGSVSRSPAALALRGEYEQLAGLCATLGDVPGVLIHGDVGTGGNVLIADQGFSIIDWETAQYDGLPLADLLPLLGLALATLRGHASTTAAAQFVLSLFAGRESDSAWVLPVVLDYCRQVDVPLAQAGALSALAWGRQASMRLVHQELVIQDGRVPHDWESPADEVARKWLGHSDLGKDWPALSLCGAA